MGKNASISTTEKIRKMPWFFGGNAGNAAFAELTVFGALFVLLLDKLGIPSEQIGILLAFFPFMGVIAVLVTPYVAQIGNKRTFILFYTLRKLFLIGILIVPWITGSVFGYISLIIAAFAICRAIAETGYVLWNKEFMPESLRGKYEGISQFVIIIASLAAIGVSSYVLSISDTVATYLWLFGVGIVVGLLGVWSYSRLPGGARIPDLRDTGWQMPDIKRPFADPQFARFMWGVSLVTLTTSPVVSFFPLYLIDVVGLPSSAVIQLQFGTKIGALAVSILWGWAADRYGSKPVMVTSVFLIGLLMVFLFILPSVPIYIFAAALAASLLMGAVFVGWQIGFSRLLFNGIVTEENKQDALPVYYATAGFAGGLGQIIGGWVLASGWSVSPYQILLITGIVLMVVSIAIFRKVHEEHAVSVREFMKYWVSGNPVFALDSVFRFGWGANERNTVKIIHSLTAANSHLTVHEILEALNDPRFQVRYGAVNAIARMRQNDKLTDALAQVLSQNDPVMSTAAVWALGHIGDSKSIDLLRSQLASPFRSVREQAIRSLTFVKDPEVQDDIYKKLVAEKDHALSLAYSAYLGKVKYVKALPLIIDLYQKGNSRDRRELGLALSRMFIVSRTFLRELKHVDTDAVTYLALFSIKVGKVLQKRASLPPSWEHIEGALAFGEWEKARVEIERLTNELLPEKRERSVAYMLLSVLKNESEDMVSWVLLLCLVKEIAKSRQNKV